MQYSTEASPKTILISGAATFPGTHFLFWQTRRAQRNLVLVSGATIETAREELLERLLACAASYRISVSPEELTQRFEVVPFSLETRELDELWHFPEFSDPEACSPPPASEKELEEIHALLSFTKQHGVKRFIHVSSAYAAGRQSGPIPEQLHSLPRDFHNQFEENRCLAEHAVANYCRQYDIDYRIVRPSIVVGPSQTALPGGSRGLLYSLTKVWTKLAAQGGEEPRTLSLNAWPETAVNLIPIDHVIADLDHLIASDFAGGPVYHTTSSHNPTVEMLVAACRKVLGGNVTVRYVEGEGESGDQLPLASGYFSEKQFERSLPRKDGVTEQELYGYLTECARELRNESLDEVFTRLRLVSSDGVPITAFEGRNHQGAPVVLINALGMAAVFWVNLARQLLSDFRVLTWESRWVPDFGAEFDSARCEVSHHVKDLVALLDSRSIDAAHLVAWCNGAQVALNFGAHFPDRIRSLVLLNGAFNFPASVPRSVVEKNMRSIMPRIATRRKDTELFFRIMGAGRFQSGPNGSSQPAQVPLSMVCSNPSLLHLTSAPFRTAELLHRYANIIMQTFNEPEHAWVDSVAVPTLVIANEDDQITDPEGSREVARRIKDCELVVLQGDHHCFYDDAAVQDRIREFLLRQR